MILNADIYTKVKNKKNMIIEIKYWFALVGFLTIKDMSQPSRVLIMNVLSGLWFYGWSTHVIPQFKKRKRKGRES